MKNYIEERFKLQNYKILGIDEAGRGNLAGPLIVAGCILDINQLDKNIIEQIDDSKKLDKKKRFTLYEIIKQYSIFDIQVIDVKTINLYGPKKASIIGMEKVIENLQNFADFIFVDFERPQAKKRIINFIHGDTISLNIAAASILAKAYKDLLMEEFVKVHPQYACYDFINNAGYGTKKHLEAIKKYGIIENFHRINYGPVKKYKNKNLIK